MKRKIVVPPVVFLLLAVLFFLPVDLPYKTAYPVAALCLLSLTVCPWQVVLALAFSAAGDAFPSSGQLIPKIICFAVAHVFYVGWFISLVGKRGSVQRKFSIAVGSVFFCVFLAAVILVTSHAPTDIFKGFSTFYAALLSTMACCAVLTRKKLLAVGAVLFLISDVFLGWGIFVSRIPGGRYFVMVPYYAGQLMIFLGSVKYLI